MNLYIGDLHFGHEKVIRFENRPFANVREMHYPMAEWNGFYRGSYHIYGHIHQKTDGAYQYMKQFDHALNAAACINNYIPCSLEELIRNNQLFKEQNCIRGENE